MIRVLMTELESLNKRIRGCKKCELCFITNIVKCRPPGNRVPKKPEVEACSGYLLKQIELIDPELIVALGQSSIKKLTGEKGKLGDIHGRNYQFKNFPVMACYHPAAVVYNRKLRPALLNDLKRIKEILSETDK